MFCHRLFSSIMVGFCSLPGASRPNKQKINSQCGPDKSFSFRGNNGPRPTDLTLGFFGCGIFGTRNGPHTSNHYCGKRGRHYRFGIYLPLLLAGGVVSPAAKLARLVVQAGLAGNLRDLPPSYHKRASLAAYRSREAKYSRKEEDIVYCGCNTASHKNSLTFREMSVRFGVF